MSDDHAFRWPDEDPAPAGLGPTVRQTVRTALVPLAAATRGSGKGHGTSRRRLRLRGLVRTRPLPLAIAMAAGVASLAWALHGTGEGEPVAAWASRDGRAATSLFPMFSTSPAPPARARAHGEKQPVGGEATTVAAPTLRPASTSSPLADRPPQWGEPLPPFRHLVEATGASIVGPALPPSAARRSPGYTVSASEYLAGQEALRLARSQAPAPGGAALAGTPPAGAGRPLLLAGLADALGLSTVQDIADGPLPSRTAPRVWTLAQAAEQALQRSPEVRAAQARLMAWRETAPPAAEPRWRADLRRLRTAFGGAAPADDADGAAGAAAARAEGAEAAEAALRATIADVGADVANRYLQALQARVVLSLALEHERQLLHLVALAQARAGTVVDESGQLDRRADQARLQVVQARQVLQAAMDDLSARVGDTPQRMLMDVPQPWRAPADLQAAMAQARQHSQPWRTADDLQSVYAQFQSTNSRHDELKSELAAQRRALGLARARLLSDSRSLDALVDRYQAVHDHRVELATLMLGDAMNQVRVARLTGQLPLAVAVADRGR